MRNRTMMTLLPEENLEDQQELGKIKIAVVLPVYNTAKYLRECLDSLIRQTHVNFNVFAVDDGSTDGSSVILDEYATRDKRFLVWHIENGGVSAARNFALEQIEKNGEFQLVAFCDSDDVVNPDFLHLYVYGVVKYKAQFVTIGYVKFDKKGIRGLKRKIMHPPLLLLGEDLLLFAIQFHSMSSVSPAAAFFLNNVALSAELVHGVRFDVKRNVGEDVEYRFRAIVRMDRGVALSDVGYNYRIRRSSLSNKGTYPMCFGLDLYLDWLRQLDGGVLEISKKIKAHIIKEFGKEIVRAYEYGKLSENWESFCEYYKKIRLFCRDCSIFSPGMGVVLLFPWGPMAMDCFLFIRGLGSRSSREKVANKMMSAYE